MIVCGIEMSGSEARLVILNGTRESFTYINIEPKKIKLSEDENQDEVKNFRDAIFTFFKENSVSLVGIKKRGKRGTFSGGPIGFKLEGIIQLHEECPIKLIAPQTISATYKKCLSPKPSELKKYQYTAFETAFSLLE